MAPLSYLLEQHRCAAILENKLPYASYMKYLGKEEEQGVVSHMKVTKQTQRKFKSFEYLDIVTTCSTGSTRIVTIYRPPPSKANELNIALFFEEFCIPTEQIVVSPGSRRL